LAPCFFVIFVLISQFVLVNVVVAVLMKHLEESTKRDDAAEGKSFFFHPNHPILFKQRDYKIWRNL